MFIVALQELSECVGVEWLFGLSKLLRLVELVGYGGSLEDRYGVAFSSWWLKSGGYRIICNALLPESRWLVSRWHVNFWPIGLLPFEFADNLFQLVSLESFSYPYKIFLWLTLLEEFYFQFKSYTWNSV